MTIEELETCVDTYGRELYAFCRYLTGSVPDGEDLYQETFLTAVSKLEKINIRENPKSYLMSIAVHLWKNKKRKVAGRNRLICFESVEQRAEEGEEAVDGQNPLPEDVMIRTEEQKLVQKCVETLAEIYRIPICLHYISQLSTKEIAGILKVPEGTVRRRLFMGRKQIKKKLEEQGYDR